MQKCEKTHGIVTVYPLLIAAAHTFSSVSFGYYSGFFLFLFIIAL